LAHAAVDLAVGPGGPHHVAQREQHPLTAREDRRQIQQEGAPAGSVERRLPFRAQQETEQSDPLAVPLATSMGNPRRGDDPSMTRLLAVADEVDEALYGDALSRLRPDLIVSAGDLPFDYLENLVTRANVPLVYV